MQSTLHHRLNHDIGHYIHNGIMIETYFSRFDTLEIYSEMQVKTKMRYHPIHIRMAVIQTISDNNI